MTKGKRRSFSAIPAVRQACRVLIGLVGPSRSGKTYSALRLASGLSSVTGTPIVFIDTENGRALHYAEKFNFLHVDFPPPHGSADYMGAMSDAEKAGGKGCIIVVDSMSHEHEGDGGMIEFQEAEKQRLARLWNCSPEKTNASAWNAAKHPRKKLLFRLTQMDAHVICCWRSQNKMDWSDTGKKKDGTKGPRDRGEQPIGDEKWVYEMTASFLLRSGSDGLPCMAPANPDERRWVTIHEDWKPIFPSSGPGFVSLNEDQGRLVGLWATAPGKTSADPAEELSRISTVPELAAWTAKNQGLPEHQKRLMGAAYTEAQKRVTKP